MTRTHDSHGRLLVRIGKVTVVRRPLQPMVCSGRLTMRSPKCNPLPGLTLETCPSLCRICGTRPNQLQTRRVFDCIDTGPGNGAPGCRGGPLSGLSDPKLTSGVGGASVGALSLEYAIIAPICDRSGTETKWRKSHEALAGRRGAAQEIPREAPGGRDTGCRKHIWRGQWRGKGVRAS